MISGISYKADQETVKEVQTFLNKKGYDCGTPDGIAGKKTRNSIINYQEDNGLFPSGLVDDNLLRALG